MGSGRTWTCMSLCHFVLLVYKLKTLCGLFYEGGSCIGNTTHVITIVGFLSYDFPCNTFTRKG